MPRRALRAGLIVLALAASPPPALPAPRPGVPAGPPSSGPAPAPAGTAGSSGAGDEGGAVAADRAAGITTPVWREPREPLDLAWHVLAVPEYVVDLLFSPLGFAVGVVERYRLERRIIDLLQNDAGTIKLVPAFKFSTGDSLGIGGSLELENLLGRGEELDVGGVILLNRDHTLEATYDQTFATLDGRGFEASVEYELNQDLDYYGLGNDTRPRDHRVIDERSLNALASLQVFARGASDSYGLVELGYRRTTLAPGIDVSTAPVGEPGDTVGPPADFDRTTSHALFGLVLRHDSRDTPARTQRGILAEASARLTSGLRHADFSALSLGGEVTGYIPLLPLYRVLVGRFGVQGVFPPYGNGEVPLDEYVMLGRKHGLRGFPNYRFRDRVHPGRLCPR
ncbi:MAG TPA: BamA/TamA family outer membrane protein, partial [Candidatus Acidoferrum sp.]|nr:BamA/TamA family outer membrane protein [Candidatus Acidoferrum sp.]